MQRLGFDAGVVLTVVFVLIVDNQPEGRCLYAIEAPIQTSAESSRHT